MRFSLLAFFLVTLTSLNTVQAEPLIIKYGDREVDISPYYFTFPYEIQAISIENKKVYYTMREPDGGSYLYVQQWDGGGQFDINTDSAEQVTDVDIEGINFWNRSYNKVLDALIVSADDANREDVNLWLFSEDNSTPIKLTDADLIPSFSQSPDHRSVVLTSRYGTSDDQEGCLELLTVADDRTASTRKLFCDSDNKIPAKLNSRGALLINDKSIIFSATIGASNYNQFTFRYDRLSGEVTRLDWPGDVISWIDEGIFLHVGDMKFGIYDIVSGSDIRLHSLLSRFSVGAMEIGEQTYIYTITNGVSETAFEVFRLVENQLVKTDGFVINMTAKLVHAKGGTIILSKESTTTIIDYEKIDVDQAGRIQRSDFITGLPQLTDQLAACKVSLVTYKSVDHIGDFEIYNDIDAYLYEPRNPIAADDRLYVIEAFYGGRNSFSPEIHSFCQVGITTLSPVVRGDSRLGSVFEDSNNVLRADAPIRDVIAGARYLQSKYEIIDSRRIGTMGYSQGGWAAVRALSYPGPEHFEFGFALAGAGLYNFLQIADGVPEGQTNVPGAFQREFGGLDTGREYLAYLSATSHMDQINAPIFLFHGRNDERITVLHSISFAERLRAAGKSHELLIIENQGHAMRGAENWHQVFDTMFKFLEAVNAGLN